MNSKTRFGISLLFVLLGIDARTLENPISDDVCENIHSFTCKEKIIDPTGGRNKVDRNQVLTEVLAKLQDAYNIKAKKILDDPNQSKLREVAAQAFDVSENGDICAGKNLKSEKCTEVLAAAFGLMAKASEARRSEFFIFDPLKKTKVDLEKVAELYHSKAVQGLVKEVDQYLVENAVSESTKSRIEEFIPKIKNQFRNLFEKHVKDPKIKSEFLTELERIRIKYDCTSSRERLSATQRQSLIFAHYDGHVNICEGTANQLESEYAIVLVIAHEMGHAFDPCNFAITHKAGQEFPLGNILECFLDKRSVGAKTNVKVDSIIGHILPRVCRSQLGETTADWWAAEVISGYMKDRKYSTQESRRGYINAALTNCDPLNTKFFTTLFSVFFEDTHPSTDTRANRLLLAQPEVRRQMGCDPASKAKYCKAEEADFDSPAADAPINRGTK